MHKERHLVLTGNRLVFSNYFGFEEASQRLKERTSTMQKAAGRRVDINYIPNGYGAEKVDYLKILTTLAFLHNKTCREYTHLTGCAILPLLTTVSLRYLATPRFLRVSSVDYAMFGLYFWREEVKIPGGDFGSTITSESKTFQSRSSRRAAKQAMEAAEPPLGR